MVARVAKKIAEKGASDMVKEAVGDLVDSAKKAVTKKNIRKADLRLGAGMRSASKKLKKLGKEVGEKTADIQDKAKRAGSWVKKNKGKVALGAGAVAAGAYAAKDDKNSVKSQLAKIKAKDPSERTASEKRLLRLMED